jgi:hypothetical protein
MLKGRRHDEPWPDSRNDDLNEDRIGSTKTGGYRTRRGPRSDASNLYHRGDPRGLRRRVVASQSLHPSLNDEGAKVSAVHTSPRIGEGGWPALPRCRRIA